MSGDSDLAVHMEAVARALLGEPNALRSSKTELRFGTHGSMSVDLEKGTYFSHEDQTGGGVLDLVKLRKGIDGAAASRGCTTSSSSTSASAGERTAQVGSASTSRPTSIAMNAASRSSRCGVSSRRTFARSNRTGFGGSGACARSPITCRRFSKRSRTARSSSSPKVRRTAMPWRN
jgi:hypothetical protein